MTGLWAHVQERVSLTPAQQEQIIALRCELLQQMEAILQERRATFTNLQVRVVLPAHAVSDMLQILSDAACATIPCCTPVPSPGRQPRSCSD